LDSADKEEVRRDALAARSRGDTHTTKVSMFNAAINLLW
jgi:hypothetical protein